MPLSGCSGRAANGYVFRPVGRGSRVRFKPGAVFERTAEDVEQPAHLAEVFALGRLDRGLGQIIAQHVARILGVHPRPALAVRAAFMSKPGPIPLQPSANALAVAEPAGELVLVVSEGDGAQRAPRVGIV